MRNLKRTLSLALAAVMLMGMMIVGAGAASSDFTDADEITNVEAVDVMVGLGILEGGDQGDFQPNSILTREQAAKIICYMLLGEESAEKLTTNSTVFNDVAADRWSAPYIGYCVNLGILAGDGNGNFFPEGQLTGAAFAKMLLVALGYDATIEKYVGSDWMISVAADAIEAGIAPSGLVLSNNLSRQDAAQMAFLTLTANTVKYASKGTTVIGSDGMQVIVGNTPAERVDNSLSDDYRTEDGDAYQQFCEKYFADLEKDTTTAKNTKDDFARPGYSWVYDGDVIAFVSDEPVATYAGADFDEDVVDTLNEDYTGLADAPVYYNGGTDASVDLAKLQDSVKGYNIEIYANNDDEVTAIVVTEGYVAEVATINTDDDDAVTSVELDVYEAGYYISHSNTYATIEIDAEDDADAYAMIENYEEGDVLMMFLKPGWDTASDMDATVLDVDDVESVDGTVTSSSITGHYNGWVRIDGERYDFANEYSQAAVGTDSEGTFYLYNGYVVHFDGSTEDAAEYLYVVRNGSSTGTWGEESYYAEVVYADGTSEVIDTEEAYAAGVYSYEYDEDESYYVLSGSVASTAINIEKGRTGINGTTSADSQTVYVSIKLDAGKFDSASTYTGYRNVPSMTAASGYVVAESGEAADYVFILDGTTVASADDLIYIAGDSVSGLINDSDLGEYYTYDAVVNGEIVEIMVAKSAGTGLDGLYDSYKVDEDGIYSDLSLATEDTDYYATTGSFTKASNEVIGVGADGTMAYTDDVAVYVVATDGAITAGSINRNYSDLTSILYTVDSDGAVTTLYLVR